MANHLGNEASLYLRQHADNPVDWYPWGPEALGKARAEDKPIFLSIGYSACHWCHVMAHESFEDEIVASILNEHFVSIKVDREERPDLDRIYMAAVQSLTGRGGWPMSVFLTAEGKPFYGGTYFPPEPRHGLASFEQVLRAIADAWRDRREELQRAGESLTSSIGSSMERGQILGSGEALTRDTLDAAVGALASSFDRLHGGWGGAPKFPQSMTLEFLLRHHHSTGDQEALWMVTRTLEAMARGGMYDQIGGGFHRYSVDERWHVPHFEKMLYDNAQLSRVYLHAWQVTGEPLIRAIVEETLDYVAREMTDPDGGFYCSQDADSEGEEGAFFLWTAREIESVLGEEAARFLAAYGAGAAGTLDGKLILHYEGSLGDSGELARARGELLAARSRRVRPGRDDKVLASWNGLMLAAFAEAGQALGRDDYLRLAERNADFLLREVWPEHRRLFHAWKAGEARLNAYLDDYTHLIEGLLALYQATFASRWYVAARDLAEQMIARFRVPGGFSDTSSDHETLIVRPRTVQDNALPSGNAMAATVLMRLADLSRETRYADLARESLRTMQPTLAQYPSAHAQWLIALDHALAPHVVIAIVGGRREAHTESLIGACTKGYHPHRTVAAGDPALESHVVPAVQGHESVDGRAAAYVCKELGCLPPVSDPAALTTLLTEGVPEHVLRG